MPTQKVDLTPELDEFVRKQVAGGEFRDESEVHRAALAQMARCEQERELRLQLLRREIQDGIDDLDRDGGGVVINETGLDALMDDCLDRALSR